MSLARNDAVDSQSNRRVLSPVLEELLSSFMCKYQNSRDTSSGAIHTRLNRAAVTNVFNN
jgi:hypothetical protein